MNQFNVFGFLDDMNLSFSLASICNINGYNLIFPNVKYYKLELSMVKYGIVIIDINDKKIDAYALAGYLHQDTGFLIVGYLDTLNRKEKLHAQKAGFDIVMNRDTLFRNLDIILTQAAREIGESKSTNKKNK